MGHAFLMEMFWLFWLFLFFELKAIVVETSGEGRHGQGSPASYSAAILMVTLEG